MNEWAQFISSVGFPITASCGIFYLYNKTVSEITHTLGLMNQTLTNILRRLDMENEKNDTE